MIPVLKHICWRIRNNLQTSIALLTLIILLFHIYNQSSSGSINHEIRGSEKQIHVSRTSAGRHIQGSEKPTLFSRTTAGRQIQGPDKQSVVRLTRSGNIQAVNKPDLSEGGSKLSTSYHKPTTKINADEEMKRYIVRRTLTKSLYPITLTAPYLIENPDICSGVNVTVLFIVNTATTHFDRRQGIRETFGNRNIFKTINNRIVFLLGRTFDGANEAKIREENSKYGDIVQGEFIDTYHNLTLKGVMGLRWITEHCSHAKLILKQDDDFFIDVFKVVELVVAAYATKTMQIVCNLMQPSYVLRDKGRWHVDEDYFRGFETYPTYCSGFTVFMTPDMVRVMYHAAFFTPFFWVDDVYMFGLLPSKQYKIPTKFLEFSLSPEDCFNSYNSSKPTYFMSCSVVKEEIRRLMWGRTLAKLSEKTRRTVNFDVMAMQVSKRSET